ncbi:unnamed protein product [Camellia sinensis]
MVFVKEIKKEFLSEQSLVELPQHLKQKITDEIVGRLRGLRAGANVSEQREAFESWRKEKLKEAKQLTLGKTLSSTVPPKEAKDHCYLELQGDMLVGTLARALESGWSQLSNEIGLWIPVEINNEEHDDKLEGATDFDDEILAGRQLPHECHPELHTDYDGAAVRWGLTHHKEVHMTVVRLAWIIQNVPDQAKRNAIYGYIAHQRQGAIPPTFMSTNIWSAGSNIIAEKPRVNFKDKYSESYRNSHPNVPVIVPWVSGVVTA